MTTYIQQYDFSDKTSSMRRSITGDMMGDMYSIMVVDSMTLPDAEGGSDTKYYALLPWAPGFLRISINGLPSAGTHGATFYLCWDGSDYIARLDGEANGVDFFGNAFWWNPVAVTYDLSTFSWIILNNNYDYDYDLSFVLEYWEW